MITVYKLTDADMFTRRGMAGETLWRVGVPSPVLDGNTLCRAGIWHAYEHPLTAAFMDIVHANLGLNARLWRAHAPAIVTRDDCLKCGVSQLTLVEELPLPVISTAARVRAAIEAALSVYNESGFVAWASAWLSGEDRRATAAEATRAAARAAATAAARAAWAAWAAAEAWAAEAAWAAATAAASAATTAAARAAATAAARAAATAEVKSFDLPAVIEAAMQAEEYVDIRTALLKEQSR